MPVPLEIDKKIRKKFADLESEMDGLIAQTNDLYGVVNIEGSSYISDYHRIRTSFLNLIQILSTKRGSFSDLTKDVRNAHTHIPAQLQGMLLGLKSDYEDGMLVNITEMVETNVVADYLTQAELLFKGDKKGIHHYAPAAVLAGAVFEDGLRRLCARQEPPISQNKRGGSPKTMGTLIEDLKKATVFNELKAKQLRAWADIRNAAAHGRFDDFTEADVEQLLTGIRNFLADNL